MLRNIIPSNFNNLIGLMKRLLLTKNSAGKAAIWYSFLGLVMIPLDWFLQIYERKLYAKSSKPQLPLLFVCGPPRSGTTLVAQVLIKHLPVYYFNNLTSIFPNSPLIANTIFGRFIKKGNKDVSFKSLYGRTTPMGGPNDALYLWDRWTGVDRKTVPKMISGENQTKMQQFFGAVEKFSGKPLVNKNNKLNTYAQHVAKVLDTAYFICLDRDPVYLAQSQLIASRFIHGDEKIPYGARLEALDKSGNVDPVMQVCNQVSHYRELMQRQERLIGKERFIIVPYEDFCADPSKWVCKISEEILGQTMDYEALRKTLDPFQISNDVKVDKEVFDKIENSFNNLKNPM